MVVVVVSPFGVVVVDVDVEDLVEAVVTTSSGVVDFVGAGVVIWTEIKNLGNEFKTFSSFHPKCNADMKLLITVWHDFQRFQRLSSSIIVC